MRSSSYSEENISINFKINDKFFTLTVEVFVDKKFFGITTIPRTRKLRVEDQETVQYITETLKEKIKSFEGLFNFKESDRHYIMDKNILNILTGCLK